MTEQELLLDCLRRLNRQNLAYMLTGSMASNAWGIPRTTHDLDFVVQLPASQIASFVAAFQSEGYFGDEASSRCKRGGWTNVICGVGRSGWESQTL